LVYFCLFGMFGPRKIWQPWSSSARSEHAIFLHLWSNESLKSFIF
jgi:hypothetical protein